MRRGGQGVRTYRDTFTRGHIMVEPLEEGVVVVRGGAEGFAQEITLGRDRKSVV